MVKAQGAVWLVVGEVREEREIEVPWQNDVRDERTQLHLIKKKLDTHLTQLVLKKGRKVGDEGSTRHPRNFHLGLDAVIVARRAQ